MSKIGIKFMEGGKVFDVDCVIETSNGDIVVVETVRGIELAYVCPTTKKNESQDEIKSVIRIATDEEVKDLREAFNF